jgi:hypothetical protein
VKYTILHLLHHDGRDYQVGDTIELPPDDHLTELLLDSCVIAVPEEPKKPTTKVKADAPGG